MPAVTVNHYGNGKAYYIATDLEINGYIDLYKKWFTGVISPDKIVDAPDNVSITFRYSDEATYVFVMNFNGEVSHVELPFEYEILGGDFDGSDVAPYGVVVLKKK
jgi:beta-galactosidase